MSFCSPPTRKKTHAKQFYGQLAQLNGQTIQIDGTYPVDPV